MAFSIIFPQRAQDIRHFNLFHEDPVDMAYLSPVTFAMGKDELLQARVTKPQRLYVRIVWIVCTYGDPSK